MTNTIERYWGFAPFLFLMLWIYSWMIIPYLWIIYLEMCLCMLVIWSCSTVLNPIDCSLPGSFVCGIFQARILEWPAISFTRGSSQPRDQTQVSCIAGRLFTIWATREAMFYSGIQQIWNKRIVRKFWNIKQ